MNTTAVIDQAAHGHDRPVNELPAGIHVAYSGSAKLLNETLLDGFLEHQHDRGVKRTHLFNGRYENIYLTPREIPRLRDLLEEACDHAGRILGCDDLQAGCWFNFMPPGAVTTLHSHDDDDELLSAVYYVSAADNSGDLVIHQNNSTYAIAAEEGKFVFFAPDVPHEVTRNLSSASRLSIGINFGRRRNGAG